LISCRHAAAVKAEEMGVAFKSGGKVGTVVAAMSILVLAGVAGCVTTHGNLASSADRLERNADALTSDSRYTRDHGTASYSRDARELAEETRDFRETLADRIAGERCEGGIRACFPDLSQVA
jgi:hypothetical protein